MKKYETVVILDGDIEQSKLQSYVDKFSNILEKYNAQVREVVPWEKRQLAYKLNKKSYGYYYFFYLEIETDKIKEVLKEAGYESYILKTVFINVKDIETERQFLEEIMQDAGSNVKNIKSVQ